MKKATLFALAALCVSAAQAVTVSWSSNDFTAQQSQTIDLSAGKSATIAMTITFTEAILGISSDATFASLTTGAVTGGLKNNGTGAHMHAYSANNGIGANIGAGGTGTWTDNRPAVGTTKHSVIMTLANDGTKTTLKLYADGEQMGRGTPNTFEYTVSEMFFNTAANGELWTIGEAAIYDGVLDADQIATLVANGSATLPTVPEPTALALLALGVAGLALKRKVA